MAIDPRYGNSSGYFKDPITEEDLSPDTPRVIPCSFENGKFTWPCVAQSDGEQLLKIVYKYFTDEEKELYKAYRGRSSSGSERKPREPKQQITKSTKIDEPVESKEPEEPAQVIKYSKESAASLKTLELLAQCDTLYGISQISGIFYALVGKSGSRVIHHIPRACIPDAEFERLNEGRP